MINLSRYNFLLFFIYLFLCAYNFVFYVTYSEDKCIQTVAVARILPSNFLNFESSTFLDFDFFPQNRTIHNSENHKIPRNLQSNSTTISNATQQLEQLLSTIQLTQVPLGIAIIYLILAFLSLVASCSINWFSHMLPEKFASLGCCKGSVGCFIRNNPKFVRFVHYVLGILICVQFILIFGTPACTKAKHINGETMTVGEMWDQAIVYNIVTLIFWGAMFCGLPFVKPFLPQEAFIFEPYDSDHSLIRYVFCTFLGPN